MNPPTPVIGDRAGWKPAGARPVRVSHVITRLIVGGAQENTLASVLGLGRRPEWQVELVSGPTRGPEGSLEPMARSVPGLLALEPSLEAKQRPLPEPAPAGPIHSPEDFRRRHPDGRMGSDPFLAKADHGQRLLDLAATALVDDMEAFLRSEG